MWSLRPDNFSASEVQTVLAMLRILDNPYQDIPMAAVLRSPLVGLDEEEMAQIRVENPECSFAEAAMHAMQDATEGALYDFSPECIVSCGKKSGSADP